MYLYTDSLSWMAVATLGIIYSGLSIREALGDIHALKMAGENGAKKRLSRVAVVNESLRTVVQVLFFIVGALSMLSPSRSPWSINVFILMAAQILIVLNTVILYRERGKILEEIVRANGAAKQSTLLGVKADVLKVQEGVTEVKEAADAAYEEANDMNEKITKLAGRMTESEEREDGNA